MKYICLILPIVFYFSPSSNAQTINFASEYDKIYFPFALGFRGGITGDDYQYKKLTLFHGNSITFQTGTNEPNMANQRMVINSNGSIGIGINTPQAKLHVGAAEGDGITIGNPNDGMGGNGGSYAIKFYGYRDITPNAISAKITAERTNACCNYASQGTDIAFYTVSTMSTANADNSLERMRIKDNGNIGIGTASPSVKFHIYDNTDPRLLIQRNDKRLFFYWDPTNSVWQIDTYNTDATRSNLSLNANGGNVGIGTANPVANLHIYGTSNPQLQLQNAGGYTQIARSSCNGCYATGGKSGDLVIKNLGDSHNTILYMPDNSNDGNSYIKIGDDNGLWAGFFNNRLFRVDGKIIAKSFEIKSNVWADYVFQNDYKLMKLEDLEGYISKNKHLPGIPTQKEIVENGINVSEITVKMMEKIEEMSLYIIQQEKRIKELEKNNFIFKR